MMLPVCFFRRLFARPVCVLTLSVAAFASVAVTATPASTATRFSDVRSEGWEVDAIEWFDTQRITQGCHADRFCPDQEMSREQQLTFLWRYEGSPAPGDGMPFTDVEDGMFFTDPITWAFNEGVTEGIGNNEFGTGRDVTRAEAITFLWRYVGEPEPWYRNEFMADVRSDAFYYNPVRWATEIGVTKGCNLRARKFCPDRPVTRAEFATFLYRLDQYVNDPEARPRRLEIPEPPRDPDLPPVLIYTYIADQGDVVLTGDAPDGFRPAWSFDVVNPPMRNAHVEGCAGEIGYDFDMGFAFKVADGCETKTGTAEWRFEHEEYSDAHIWLPVILHDKKVAWTW